MTVASNLGWLMVAPSCSLLHVPVDLAQETRLEAGLKTWLDFAVQKLGEVATLAHGADDGIGTIAAALRDSGQIRASARRIWMCTGPTSPPAWPPSPP